MMKVKLFKSLALTENFLGLYRNYVLLDGNQKRLVRLRVAFEIIILIGLGLYNTYGLYKVFHGINRNLYPKFFFVYGVIKSIAEIITSIKYSKQYQIFLTHIDKLENVYKDDALFIKNTRDVYRCVIVNIIIFVISRMAFFIMHLLKSVQFYTEYGNMSYSVLKNLYEVWMHGRFNMLYMTLSSLTMLICTLMKCLNKSVSNTLREADSSEKRLKQTLEKYKAKPFVLNESEVELWSMVYSNLVICCKFLNLIFSKQVLCEL